jgi:hypothetical protein
MLGNALAFNFTVICMKKLAPANLSDAHDVEGLREVPMFTNPEKTWLYSAIPLGSVLGTLPISYLTTQIGVRFVCLSLKIKYLVFIIYI